MSKKETPSKIDTFTIVWTLESNSIFEVDFSVSSFDLNKMK